MKGNQGPPHSRTLHNPRSRRRKNVRTKLPPHEIVIKKIHGQLVPVRVFRPAWADGVEKKPGVLSEARKRFSDGASDSQAPENPQKKPITPKCTDSESFPPQTPVIKSLLKKP